MIFGQFKENIVLEYETFCQSRFLPKSGRTGLWIVSAVMSLSNMSSQACDQFGTLREAKSILRGAQIF